jgi:hypothetical protein
VNDTPACRDQRLLSAGRDMLVDLDCQHPIAS